MSDSKFVEVASLWKNQNKENKDYYVGYMGACKVFVFEKREPDERGRTHTLFVAPAERKGESQ